MSLQTTPANVPEFTFGWRLRLSLEGSAETVGSLATKLGYSRSQLSRWMHDDGQPRRSVVAQWALATGVPLEWLATGQNPNSDGGGDGDQPESPTYWYDGNVSEMGRVAHLQVAA